MQWWREYIFKAISQPPKKTISTFATSVNDYPRLSLACNTKNTLMRVYSSKSFQKFSSSTFSIMKVSMSTYFLASLMATLVLVTTSLPQSPSGRPDGISNRGVYPYDPFHFRPLRRCLGVGALNNHQDLKHKLLKRDSQSPGAPVRALDPRLLVFPCGRLASGGQT